MLPGQSADRHKMINVQVDKAALAKVKAQLEKRKQRAIKRETIRSALAPGAAIGMEEAKRIVPVRTGALRDSLKIRKTGNSLTIGTNLPYANSVEFKVKPFLRPVIESKDKEIIEAVRQEYKKRVI